MRANLLVGIARILLDNGNQKCVVKAESFQLTPQTAHLNLRDLELNSVDVISIAHLFKIENEHPNCVVKSISFSYNPFLGNAGAIALSKYLPSSLSEIGLVGCGISDTGGIALLKQIKKLSNLSMICIEGNNFSETLQAEFQLFKNNNPNILVVF